MVGASVKITDETHKVVQAVERAKYRSLNHAAASIRKDARKSIKTRPKKTVRVATGVAGKTKRVRVQTRDASPKGTPPYTRRGRLRNAIVYHATKSEAVIGPRRSIMGEGAVPHEFGGRYKDQTYPKRPTMGPALIKNLDRFAASFSGSLGQ